MFFTQEDYRKIEKWLTANSRKDTDFAGAATPLKGNETVVLVQNGKNVKTSVKDIVDQFFLLGVSDFLNITDKYGESYISIDQAIQLIPFRSRKEGQVITFLNTDGNWEIYQFIGKLNQWNIPTLWNNPFDWEKFIIDSILPDEEDLTKSPADANGNSYLSLKDREYNPNEFSGLGRVILRKNIVEIDDPIYGKITKNILFQDMIAQSNTIYEIRYDFDLNGAEITIPTGCTLDFQGGSFSNGTIVGNDTKVIYSSRIFHESIEFEGTWLIPRISTEMFYSLAGENSIKKLMLLSNPTIHNAIIIEEGDYTVSVSANKEEVLKLNSNTELIINGNIKLVANEFPNYYIISSNNCSNIHISGNGTIEGDKDTHTGATGEWGMGININNCNGVIIENITIKQCWGDCIYIGTNSKNVKIFNCFLSESRRQGISVTSASEVIIDNCTISNISGTDPQSAIDLEPNANEIITNVIIRNITVRTCSCGIISYKPDSGIISNVVISNCYIDNITANKSTIILYGITNSIVRNVIIKNSPDRGITVTNCDGYVIEDCVIDMLPANRGITPTRSTSCLLYTSPSPRDS